MAKRYLLWTMHELTTEPDRDVVGIETQEGVELIIEVKDGKTEIHLPFGNRLLVPDPIAGTTRIIISPIEKPAEEPST